MYIETIVISSTNILKARLKDMGYIPLSLSIVDEDFLTLAGDLKVWTGEQGLQVPFWSTADHPDKWKFVYLSNVATYELNELTLGLLAVTFIKSIENN